VNPAARTPAVGGYVIGTAAATTDRKFVRRSANLWRDATPIGHRSFWWCMETLACASVAAEGVDWFRRPAMITLLPAIQSRALPALSDTLSSNAVRKLEAEYYTEVGRRRRQQQQ